MRSIPKILFDFFLPPPPQQQLIRNSPRSQGRDDSIIAHSVTTRAPWSEGGRLSKSTVQRYRQRCFSALALMARPSSVFGRLSQMCHARASSLASSRSGGSVQSKVSNKDPRKSSAISGSVGCGGCDRLFMLFPPQATAKNIL